MNINSVITFIAESIDKANSVDDLCWGLAKNCISHLDFEDCFIYLINENKQCVIQKAALDYKNLTNKKINNPVEIPIGKGIVGCVAKHGVAQLINDTSKDDRYVSGDSKKYSELTVPIKIGQKLIGIIDSEHSSKNFFNTQHLTILTVIANITATKISELQTNSSVLNKSYSTDEKIKTFSDQEENYLILNTQAKTYKINKNEVLRVEADGNYCTIYTTGLLKIMTAKTLKNMEKELNSPLFLRPHKSHLVNLQHIEECGNKELVLSDKTIIPISVRKQPTIKRALLKR